MRIRRLQYHEPHLRRQRSQHSVAELWPWRTAASGGGTTCSSVRVPTLDAKVVVGAIIAVIWQNVDGRHQRTHLSAAAQGGRQKAEPAVAVPIIAPDATKHKPDRHDENGAYG